MFWVGFVSGIAAWVFIKVVFTGFIAWLSERNQRNTFVKGLDLYGRHRFNAWIWNNKDWRQFRDTEAAIQKRREYDLIKACAEAEDNAAKIDRAENVVRLRC